MRTTAHPPLPPWMWIAAGAWIAFTCWLGAAFLMPSLPPPVVPALIATPTLALVLTYRQGGAFAQWVQRQSLPLIVGAHFSRVIVGAVFLILASMDRMPMAFAGVAGVGDIVVGLWAVPVAMAARKGRLGGLALWNIVGLIDILLVVVNAQRMILFEGNAQLPEVMGSLPMLWVPTLLVPFVISSHIYLLRRR